MQVHIERPPIDRRPRQRMASYGAYSSRVPFNQLPDPTPYYDLLETIGEGEERNLNSFRAVWKASEAGIVHNSATSPRYLRDIWSQEKP